MLKQSLGLIETQGLAAAVEAADAAVKSANVKLVGYELTRGGGWTTVKIVGDVGAVKAAVQAASVAASKVNRIVSTHVIPRPSQSLETLVFNANTVGTEPQDGSQAAPKAAKSAPTAPKAEVKVETKAKSTAEAPKATVDAQDVKAPSIPQVKDTKAKTADTHKESVAAKPKDAPAPEAPKQTTPRVSTTKRSSSGRGKGGTTTRKRK